MYGIISAGERGEQGFAADRPADDSVVVLRSRAAASGRRVGRSVRHRARIAVLRQDVIDLRRRAQLVEVELFESGSSQPSYCFVSRACRSAETRRRAGPRPRPPNRPGSAAGRLPFRSAAAIRAWQRQRWSGEPIETDSRIWAASTDRFRRLQLAPSPSGAWRTGPVPRRPPCTGRRSTR